MSNKVICPVCGTEFEGGWTDDCPFCDWTYMGNEDNCDEHNSGNPITLRQARENVRKGLNIWGDPLPKT